MKRTEYALVVVWIVCATNPAAAQETARQLTWNSNDQDARADQAARADRAEAAVPHRSRDDLVRAGYAYSAFGIERQRAAAAGVGAVRDGFEEGDDPRGAGGVRIWGAPVSRVTLLGEIERRMEGDEVAPSAGLLVTALGGRSTGWALAGLGRYKMEGFAEVEGEVEAGILFSLVRGRWFGDLNAIVGTGVEESEFDGEALARAGFAMADWITIGIDSQVRYRLAGDRELAGGRTWDATAGLQVVGDYDHFFAALNAGPTTVGIADGIGWSALALIGGSVP